jgi:hypothetical protein
VIHLYKKGNTQDFANYRPISLLNIAYKVLAAILQTRVAASLEPHIHPHQYGFRKARSTQQAIHLVRRMLEQGESTTSRLLFLLLDWEKAFDKITRPGLFSALRRAGLPSTILSLIQALYAAPEFFVSIDGHKSATYRQEAGIRQGCPLSPYLFIIVMTVMFYDVKRHLSPSHVRHRATGATFDEILFADDTILISQDTRSMNTLLGALTRESAKYGLNLNHDKCQVLGFGPPSRVKFADGTLIPQAQTVKYLGCDLNLANDTHAEVMRRIREASGTLRAAHAFWRHGHCTIKFKLQALSAICYAKVLHGLEGAELTGRSLQALDVFQLRALRKILHMPTTYVDRGNTNAEVYRRAQAALSPPGQAGRTRARGEGFQLLSEAYSIRKTKFFAQILLAPPTCPLRDITFEPHTMAPRDHHPKRIGRPKQRWATSLLSDAWYELHKSLDQLPMPALNPRNHSHQLALQSFVAEHWL